MHRSCWFFFSERNNFGLWTFYNCLLFISFVIIICNVCKNMEINLVHSIVQVFYSLTEFCLLSCYSEMDAKMSHNDCKFFFFPLFYTFFFLFWSFSQITSSRWIDVFIVVIYYILFLKVYFVSLHYPSHKLPCGFCLLIYLIIYFTSSYFSFYILKYTWQRFPPWPNLRQNPLSPLLDCVSDLVAALPLTCPTQFYQRILQSQFGKNPPTLNIWSGYPPTVDVCVFGLLLAIILLGQFIRNLPTFDFLLSNFPSTDPLTLCSLAVNSQLSSLYSELSSIL